MKNVHLPTLAFYAGLVLVAAIVVVRYALPSSGAYQPRVVQIAFVIIGSIIMLYRMGMAKAKKQQEQDQP